jgi:hypothetical protein
MPGISQAHEGHRHEEVEAQAAMAQPFALDTPQVEAVAQHEDGDIVLYLDDYASNAPLDGLQVSVRSGTLTLQAAGGKGRYLVPADLLPGSGTLELLVQGAGIDTRLQVELAPAAAHEAAPVRGGLFRAWPGAAVLVAALSIAVLVTWRLRRRHGARGREAPAG